MPVSNRFFNVPDIVFSISKNTFSISRLSSGFLKYVSAPKTLVFDHIGRSTLTGVIGPDGNYDAFKYVKDHWEVIEDVDVNNGFGPKKKTVKLCKDGELGK